MYMYIYAWMLKLADPFWMNAWLNHQQIFGYRCSAHTQNIISFMNSPVFSQSDILMKFSEAKHVPGWCDMGRDKTRQLNFGLCAHQSFIFHVSTLSRSPSRFSATVFHVCVNISPEPAIKFFASIHHDGDAHAWSIDAPLLSAITKMLHFLIECHQCCGISGGSSCQKWRRRARALMDCD